MLGNGPHMLGNGPHMLGNGPHVLVLCRIRYYVVRHYVAFVLMSFGIVSFSVMSLGVMSVYREKHVVEVCATVKAVKAPLVSLHLQFYLFLLY